MSQIPAYHPPADQGGSAGRPSVLDRLRDLPWLPSALVGAALLTFAYAPNIMSLATIWDTEPNYSHGFLVIPIAAVILWRRIADRPYTWTEPATSWRTWALLAGMLVLRAFAYERGMSWVENATLIPTAACIVYALGGGALLSRAWPAIGFLVFMLPLPPVINRLVALPLQQIATAGSCFVMQLTGLWVVPAGNVINLSTPRGPQQLEVAMACNGLSMLMTLAATVTATVILVPMPIWKRIVVLLSALPIALVSNMARIVGTGWCYYLMEGELARERSHDWAGFLMMPLALLLVGLEVAILSWLFDDAEAEAAAAARPIGLRATQRSS
ncbi:exosortase/archaeosortase family protein [Paludisphaera mucosa]|uniref:Exosortase/archaeosortase family protein n=1 Tax=Paludisphaera mucosa TaxID=3030827 RepID=A0ABT6FKR1_9BACT|nr:exosortase/archaeosortase family protein [Paludisphaera mucosa]MDG3008135.1 exosortase/archaeosortase family protein [Paludisphaera mucosa]